MTISIENEIVQLRQYTGDMLQVLETIIDIYVS